MVPWILFGAVFAVFFIIIFTLLVIFRRFKHPAVQRMKELENDHRSSKKTNPKSLKKHKEKTNEKIEKILSQISRFAKQTPEKLNKIQESLIRAGYYRENSIRIFLGIKIVSAVIFFFLYIYFGFWGNRSIPMVVLLSTVMAFVGYRFPQKPK